MTDPRLDPVTDPRLDWVQRLQAVGPLVARVAHDVNNPLGGILGVCFMLQTETDPERLKRLAKMVESQALLARDIIRAFEAATDTSELRLRTVTLAELIASTLMARTGVDKHLEDRDATVTVDQEQIRRALTALLDNATRATEGRDAPSVAIHTRSVGDTVHIEIRDNGPGIPPDRHDEVFSPTYTSRRSGNGLGLGLPTALSIVLRHGGDIVIGRPDAGASVTIVLPAARTPSDSSH